MGGLFSTEIGIIEEVWRNNSNYLVRNINENSKKCLILFSSNGLYFPDTKEIFVEKIIEQNRYEFENITKSKKIEKQFGKIIYVRDVWKSYYVIGINESEDSIDKLIKKLKELTGGGYRITTAGISSGGYMAVIAGILLNAEKVLCFSGQFHHDVSKRELLQKYENDKDRNKYFDIVELIKASNVPIVYFYPIRCGNDIKQAERVRDFDNVIALKFDYAEHANTVLPYNFKYLFDMSVERYRRISSKFGKKAFRKVEFLILTGGIEGIVDCLRGMIYLLRKRTRKAVGVDKLVDI